MLSNQTVVFKPTVVDAANDVKLGAVDAAIVWDSMAKQYPDLEFVRRHQVTLSSFERLLAESDYLTLHLPLTPESRHVMNRRTLAQMKPTAFLINTARGGLVCEADLVEALQAKRLAGAGLDVFETEPPGQTALLQLDSVVCPPHSASSDLQARDDITLAAARAIVALSRGEWPAEQIVNPGVREKFRWE